MIRIISQDQIRELTNRYGAKFEEFLTANTMNLESMYKGWCYKNWLSNCFTEMEKDDSIVTDIHMNMSTFSKFRSWPDDSWNPITDRVILKTGHFGDLWTARLMVNKTNPENVYILETDKGIRKEFTLPDFLQS